MTSSLDRFVANSYGHLTKFNLTKNKVLFRRKNLPDINQEGFRNE